VRQVAGARNHYSQRRQGRNAGDRKNDRRGNRIMFKRLREDIQAVKERDPAATSSIAILICYPGVQAVCAHRIENWFWRHGRRGFARFLSQVTRFFTGIEIHPGATLGHRVFIDHGMGVIIGETAVVGDDVTLYQGVTLGGTGKEHGKRHPNIDTGAVVGVGAAVLGNITIGARSKVGGGAVVVDNVPPDCTVVGIPGRIVAQNGMRICPADLYRRELLPDPLEAQIELLHQRLAQLEAQLHVPTPRWQGKDTEVFDLSDDQFIFGEGI
jgi:serine O-acetyltransferase